MMWLSLTALILCLAAAGALGYRVAACVLAAPTRLSRAALGSGIGLVALGLPLLWLPRVMPVGSALLVSGVLCALGALALRRLPAPEPRRNRRLTIAGVSVAGSLAYLSALAFWAEGSVGRADAGTLYMHSGLVAGIARGNFPVVNPFEPDYALQYRVALHTLGAGAVDLLDVLTPALMPHLVASTAVVLVLTLYGALAGRIGPGWALGGAGVAYAWGPLYWLLTPAAIRERGLGDVLGVIVEAPETIAWSGLFLGGPFAMATHNITALHGLIPAVVAIAAVRRTWQPPSRAAWVIAAAAFVYLAPSNEFLMLTVPTGLGLWFWVRRPLRPRQALAASAVLAAVTVLALLLAQTTSGVLAGTFGDDPDLGRLELAPNSAHFGSLPSWGFNSSGPWVTWPQQGRHDTPILSAEFLVDGGLLFWLLALALGWIAYRRGASDATPWLLIAAMNVAVAVAFRAEESAPNLNRLAQTGFTLAVPALAILGAEAFPTTGLRRRLAWDAALLAAGILCGAFVLSAMAWPRMVGQPPVTVDRLPPGARDFLLRETEVQERLLAVHGAQTTVDLFNRGAPGITLDIAAQTGQFVPYGYHSLSQVDRYRHAYGRAQQLLADKELRVLDIRYVLVDPARLTEAQAAAIDEKLADGRFEEAHRDPSGAAVIYRVRTST